MSSSEAILDKLTSIEEKLTYLINEKLITLANAHDPNISMDINLQKFITLLQKHFELHVHEDKGCCKD